MPLESIQIQRYRMQSGIYAATAQRVKTVLHNGRTMQLSSNPKRSASFLRAITSFAARFSKAAARRKIAYGAFDVIAKDVAMGTDKDRLGKIYRKEFCESLAASEVGRKPGATAAQVRQEQFKAHRLAISVIQMEFPTDAAEHLKEIDLEVGRHLGITHADIETLKDVISYTLGGLRHPTAEDSNPQPNANLRFKDCEILLMSAIKAARTRHLKSLPVKGRTAEKLHQQFDKRLMNELLTTFDQVSQDKIATRFWESAVNACYSKQMADKSALPDNYRQWIQPLLQDVIKQLGDDFEVPKPHQDSQYAWIDAIQKQIVPGQRLNAHQCMVLRHRIVERHLSEAAENFSKAEKIPLSDLEQWRAEDDQNFGELAIQYINTLEQQPHYKKVAPEIKFWIASRFAQKKLNDKDLSIIHHEHAVPWAPASFSLIGDAKVILAAYRTHKKPLLAQADEKLAQALGKDKEELDAWWELDKVWNVWQNMKERTTIDPIPYLRNACVEVARSSFVCQPGEDLNPEIESTLKTVSDRKIRELGQDYFKLSRNNPLPGLVAGILADASLRLPSRFFRH